MHTIARILVPLLIATGLLTGTAAADTPRAALSCRTVEKGAAYVTRVRWDDGTRTSYRNLNATRAPFAGARQISRSRPGWRKAPTVTRCKVLRNGAITVRTARARLSYTVPTAPAVYVAPPAYVEPRPAARGRWLTPTTLYAPVGADWQAAAAVDAWNAALPADRAVTLTTTPCTDRTCIAVRTAPMADLRLPVYGIAWWAYDVAAYTMDGCAIDLADEVPTHYRAAVMAHELGHCLGLPHWDNPASIMNTNSEHPTTPSPSDLEWMAAAYAQEGPR